MPKDKDDIKTHKDAQEQEDSVKVIGSQPDADFPKKPKTDCFYKGVSNCLSK